MRYRLWYSATHDAQQAKVAKDMIARGEGRWAMAKRQVATATKPHYRVVRVTAKFVLPETHIGDTHRDELVRGGLMIDTYQRQVDSLERQEKDYRRWHPDAVFVGEGEVYSEERFFEDYPDPFVPWEPDREKERQKEKELEAKKLAEKLAAITVPQVQDLVRETTRPGEAQEQPQRRRRFRLDLAGEE
jgi:hypothetical protein